MAAFLNKIPHSKDLGIGTTMIYLEQMATTKVRYSFLPFATYRLLRKIWFQWKCFTKTRVGGVVHDIHHNKAVGRIGYIWIPIEQLIQCCTPLRAPGKKWSHPVKTLMTDGSGVVACGSNSLSTASSVRILAMKIKKRDKAGYRRPGAVKLSDKIEQKTQVCIQIAARGKIEKTSGRPSDEAC